MLAPEFRDHADDHGSGVRSAMQATDGKRSVWLWTQDGKVHASLASTSQGR
jgi:hypothetical protein